MAEAVVEERPPALRFYCHCCNVQFANASAVSICVKLIDKSNDRFLLQNFTCPHCSKGFIEELETNFDSPIDLDSDDEATVSCMFLLCMLL